MVEHDPSQRAFLSEVLNLVSGLDLRPVTIAGYQREAFAGRGADVGLRVTIHHRVRGRDRDFHLGADAENRLHRAETAVDRYTAEVHFEPCRATADLTTQQRTASLAENEVIKAE